MSLMRTDSLVSSAVAYMLANPVSICLTTFRAERGGRWSHQLSAHEMRLLNILLGSMNFERSRAEIAGLLWPGIAMKVGAKNVEVLVSRLRKKIAPIGAEIRHEDGNYKLVLN